MDNNSLSQVNDSKQEILLDLVDESITSVIDLLNNFANTPHFSDDLKQAFGDEIEIESLQESWKKGKFIFPEIEIVNRAEINNANGAFARETNKIYLAQEFLLANINNLDAVTDVVLEEYGHFVDIQLNVVDAPGDEGDIFAALVRGEELSEGELQQLRNEDDLAFGIK